ncbi:MAG TPA: hypothetical protein VIA29_06815 [Thermoanaerobaculia bacterium]
MNEEEQAPGVIPEVHGIFERALPAVWAALRDKYLLGENEARDAEQDLRLWFQRLGRRAGGSSPVLPSDLREALLVAACQYGRSYQTWRLGGQPGDADLAALLLRDPRDVAKEIEEELERRGFDPK